MSDQEQDFFDDEDDIGDNAPGIAGSTDAKGDDASPESDKQGKASKKKTVAKAKVDEGSDSSLRPSTAPVQRKPLSFAVVLLIAILSIAFGMIIGYALGLNSANRTSTATTSTATTSTSEEAPALTEQQMEDGLPEGHPTVSTDTTTSSGTSDTTGTDSTSDTNTNTGN